ncbi:MAG: S-layer homology domain-containing protein, partial [Clostridiales bacterium]|nr:S-layer homology domain-containing protein [Clostridiales bacterium]
MSFRRRLLSFLGIFALVPVFSSVVYGGVKYKDVPENYWAFREIFDISDKGLIVGDASGNFRPEAPIDKFETTRILAKSIGYKYTNVTSEDRAYYKRAYDKNKSVITQYAKPYATWKSAYDYEISFLLEKEIYTVEDLSLFIVKDANGVQQYRALSLQEAAVYLVKL